MARLKQNIKPPTGYTHVRTVRAIEEYELRANGLRVLYMHVPGCGAVTSNLVYRVGSRHEARGETGIAHMLEHMLFKSVHDGTGKRVPTQGHKVLENAGALMNASTWLDRTNYYFTVPTPYLTQALATEAGRMRNLLIEEREFTPEQTNVLSEYEMYAGNPLEALMTEVTQAAFVSHGYGHETIGHRGDIECFTVPKLRAFYDTYYWPNNATLTIVGDIERDDALKAVRAAFGSIPRSPTPIPEIDVAEPAQAGTRRVEVRRPTPLSISVVAQKIPPACSREWATMQVIGAYLTDGPQSRLEELLVDTHLASSVEAAATPTHDAGLFSIIVHLTEGTAHETVERIVTEEFAALVTKPPSPARLETITRKLLAAERFARDGTGAISQELTECIAIGDWTRYYTLSTDIAKTTPRDIVDAARTYLTAERRTVGTLIGSAASADS